MRCSVCVRRLEDRTGLASSPVSSAPGAAEGIRDMFGGCSLPAGVALLAAGEDLEVCGQSAASGWAWQSCAPVLPVSCACPQETSAWKITKVTTNPATLGLTVNSPPQLVLSKN